MTFGCGPSCLLGCRSRYSFGPRRSVSVVGLCPGCAWYVAPTDGHGSETGRNGTAVESENMEVGAEVRGSAPAAAREGLLL